MNSNPTAAQWNALQNVASSIRARRAPIKSAVTRLRLDSLACGLIAKNAWLTSPSAVYAEQKALVSSALRNAAELKVVC